MALIQWSQDYETGLEMIDFQHKKLVSFLNDLHHAIETEGETSLLVEITLGELIKYTGYHFRDEEEMLLKANYPDFEAHQQKHIKLKERVMTFKERYDNKETIGAELLAFLKEWLVNHIQHSDFEYLNHIKK